MKKAQKNHSIPTPSRQTGPKLQPEERSAICCYLALGMVTALIAQELEKEFGIKFTAGQSLNPIKIIRNTKNLSLIFVQ